jgi:ribosomal protein S12 methylthiotransferase accessory factor
MHRKTLEKFKRLSSNKSLGKLSRSFLFTDEPKLFHYHCSSKENPEKEGSASCDFDKQKAKIKAMGEYIERFCLDNPSATFQKYSFFERDKESIDPRIFVNFRNQDMNFRREEYFNKICNSKLRWISCQNLLTGDAINLPAQLVYINYPFSEILIRPRISTGAAMHETFEEATLSGIMENIERDSYMLTYFSKRKSPKIYLEGKLKEIEDYFARYKLELNVFETTTDLRIPSFMCINVDRTEIGPAISVGLSANLNPKKAIKKSMLESQQVRQWIRYKYILDKMPNIDSKEKIKKIEDRGYYWYSINRINSLDFLLHNPDIKSSKELSFPDINSNRELIQLLSEKGVDSYSVDIGNSFLKKKGFEVVKIIQPQLHPLFLEENLPCLESDRMRKYSKGGELNNIPHPFM